MPIARYDLKDETINKSPDGEYVKFNELVILLVRARMAAKDDAQKSALDLTLKTLGLT